MPDALLTPSELELERSGLEFLRNGKFRKARDAFKALKKSQPARALPLLVEANLGLANEMMSKGLVSEANQVLAYLKTIAPASCPLEITPVSKRSTRDAWAAMVPLAAQRLAATGQPDAAVRAADEMILGAESPEHPGHPDAKAILGALEIGYGSDATERTAPLLRSIPRSSPFSHWVFFFKGMTALESGAHARAADHFRRIPPNSLLQASLPALLGLCGESAASSPPPRSVHALCAWAGHREWAEPLLQAEPLWRKKRHAKALRLLHNKIPRLLCWGAREFRADLTRLLAHQLFHGNCDGMEYAEALLGLVSTKSGASGRATVDRAFFSVAFGDYSGCAHSHFQTSLDKLDRMSRTVPLAPALLSRIFTRLAEGYIASVTRDPDDLCSPPNAKRALERAIRHDPGHLRAWLMQCDLLAMGRDRPAYHRFVDDLAKRFPQETEVLLRNGDCCIGRGAHTKALRNFENAAKIDSVDPRIARGILRARLGIAEDAYKKRRHSKVDWEFIESLATANTSCKDLSPWRVRVFRLVLDARYGMEKNLPAIAAEALPLAPGEFQFEVACRIGIAKRGLKFKEGILESMLPSRPGPQTLADFLAVIDEVQACEDGSPYDYAGNAARQIFKEHESRLVECIATRKDLITFLYRIFTARKPDIALASPVIRKWSAADPADPVLRYLCNTYTFPWLPNPPDEDFDEILIDLRNSQDPDAQRLFALFEKNRKRLIAERYGGSRDGKSFKLDLDYDPHEDIDAFDDGEDWLEDDDRPMQDAVAAIDPATANMSPKELIAALAKVLDGGSPVDPVAGKPSPSRPPKPPPGRPAASDPGQLSFDDQIFPPSQP